MNKKIGFSVLALVVVLIVITCIGLVLWRGGEDEAPPSISEESTEPAIVITPEPVTEQTVTPVPDEPDRSLVFDNRVTVQKKGDSYVDNAEEIIDIYNGEDYIDSYSFSNGFSIKSTRNLELRVYDRDIGILYGDGVTVVSVEEKDPLSKSIQEMRVDLLKIRGFGLYLSYETEGLPYGSECTIDDGLRDWDTYFDTQPYTDPTHMEWAQLLCDDVIDTAFGPALYMEYYNVEESMYFADAFILCDRDRILHINIKDNTDKNLWSYLLEVTNDGITLVK